MINKLKDIKKIQKYLEICLFFSLLIALFRVPITSGWGILPARRFLGLLPTVMMVLFLLWRLFHWRDYKMKRLSKFLLILIVILSMHSLILLFNYNYSLVYDLIPLSSSVFFSVLFLFCLSFFEFEKESLFIFFERVSFIIIWLGGAFFIVQLFVNLTADDIAEILIPTKQQLANYPNATIQSHRKIGFLFRLESSGAAILASLGYLYSSFLNKINEWNKKIIFIYVATILFAVASILVSSSITLILGSVIILSAVSVSHLKLKKVFFPLIIAAGAFAPLVWLTISPRLQAYIKLLDLFLRRDYLILNCDLMGLFFRLEQPGAMENLCRINEIILLDRMSFLGILPSLGWYFVVFFPFYFVVRYNLKIPKDCYPVLFLLLGFIIPMIHMSGVEEWGNNYFYILAVYFLIRESRLIKN